MRSYNVKVERPAWVDEPATNRQVKVLKFFGRLPSPQVRKGIASGIISRIFCEEVNRDLWERYLYMTRDEGDDSPDLAPFDLNSLANIEIPVDWFPAHSNRTSKNQRERQREMVSIMLEEGSPFDDPTPEIVFEGKHFAFTETFAYGTREICVSVARQLGCLVDDPVNSSTDFLVVGSKTKNRVTNKIVNSMIRRMDTGKPKIIAESDWIHAVQSHSGR